MSDARHVTAVEAELARRRRLWRPVTVLVGLLFAAALVVVVCGLWFGIGLLRETTPRYADIDAHFRYGSIGAEPESGIPYKLWKALPHLFPKAFENRDDYTAFGFIYGPDGDGQYGKARGVSVFDSAGDGSDIDL